MAILIIIASAMGIVGIGIYLYWISGRRGPKGIAIVTAILLGIAGICIPLEMAKAAAFHYAYCHSDSFGVKYDPTCK